MTPLVHGVRNNADFVLGPAPPTIAERFKAAGYVTGAFVAGFPVHRRFGLGRGFVEYDDRFPRGDDPTRLPYVERRADATVAAALRWIQPPAGGASKPFFIWLHLFDPHEPYEPPEPYLGRFRDRPYDGEIAYTDAQIGVLLAGIAKARPGEALTVLATSDHGESLGEHGEPTHGLFVSQAIPTRGPKFLRSCFRLVSYPAALRYRSTGVSKLFWYGPACISQRRPRLTVTLLFGLQRMARDALPRWRRAIQEYRSADSHRWIPAPRPAQNVEADQSPRVSMRIGRADHLTRLM